MDKLKVTQKRLLPDFYSGKSISFYAKLSSDFITSQYTTATSILLCRELSATNRLCQVGQILEN